MLKLIYTEVGIYLESVSQSLEDWVANHCKLALRTGQNLWVEPSSASFLIPADLPEIEIISEYVDLDNSDADCLEISIDSIWISSDPGSADGVLVAVLGEQIETIVIQLWQQAESHDVLLIESSE